MHTRNDEKLLVILHIFPLAVVVDEEKSGDECFVITHGEAGKQSRAEWKTFFHLLLKWMQKIVIKTMLMHSERKLEVSEAENSSRLILKLFLTHIFWFFQVWRDPRYIHSPPHNIHILCWVLRWQQRPGTHLQCIRQRRVLGVRTPRRCQSTRYRGKTFDCFWILNNSYRHI